MNLQLCKSDNGSLNDEKRLNLQWWPSPFPSSYSDGQVSFFSPVNSFELSFGFVKVPMPPSSYWANYGTAASSIFHNGLDFLSRPRLVPLQKWPLLGHNS